MATVSQTGYLPTEQWKVTSLDHRMVRYVFFTGT